MCKAQNAANPNGFASILTMPQHKILVSKSDSSLNALANLGVDCMAGQTGERAVILGEYILDTGATVRATAKVFKISKSTVHKDVTERLRYDNPQLYRLVKKVLEKNKQERHIRGGMATKRKYKGE